jgi:hypothetical protein
METGLVLPLLQGGDGLYTITFAHVEKSNQPLRGSAGPRARLMPQALRVSQNIIIARITQPWRLWNVRLYHVAREQGVCEKGEHRGCQAQPELGRMRLKMWISQRQCS